VPSDEAGSRNRTTDGAARTTIRDVAEAAQVSVTTVSHVLNGVTSARVAAETRQRVTEAADRLGYAPSRMARGLRLKESLTLALIGDQIVTTPYAGRIVQGAHDAAFEHGRSLLLFNTGGSLEVEQRVLETLGTYQVDGVIYAAMYHRQVVVPSALDSYPVVLLDCFGDASSPPAVVPDEYQGASDALRQLIDAGHRRIGHITIPEAIPARTARLRAVRDALDAVGAAAPLVAEGRNDAAGGFSAASELLDRADRPTAIFCFSDRMAMGAYRAAAELGLSIPRDLSIVGFDDQELIADGLHPGLTTVALPHYEMGVWAVNSLIDLSHGENDLQPGQVNLMACPLVMRSSVAPPA
jgi:LacI family transcriptional regulator